MKSNKIHSTKKEINYENIPTQLNEKNRERHSQNKYKDKKINLRFSNDTNNFIDNHHFKRNTIDVINKNENKKIKNNSIKIFNKTKTSHDNNNTITQNRKDNNNIPKINNPKENITPNKKKLNNSLRKRKSIDKNIINIIKKEDDFLTRQAKYSEKKKSDMKKLRKEIALNYSSKKSNQDCFSSGSTRNINNISFISGLSCTKSMAEIESNISKLYEWDKKRKEKIAKMQNMKDKQIKKYTYIPKINKRSSTLANKIKKKNDIKENIFERLSKEDKLAKEKKQILLELYTPTFHPKIYYSNRKRYHYRNQSSEEKRENNNNKEYVIKVNRVNNGNKKENENEKDCVDEEMKIDDDTDITQKILRKTIIENMNNKFRNNSAEKRKIKIKRFNLL